MQDIEADAGSETLAHELPGLRIEAFYPDHQSQLSRLARIDGQIKGITRMIEERRYCTALI